MLRFLRLAVGLLLASLVILSFTGLILWKTAGLKFYSVQTGSMSPALQVGDLAVSVKPASLRPGDIISYQAANNSQQIISHRIASINSAKGFIITKGDNLAYPDPAVPISSVTGRTALIVPKAGYFIDAIHQPVGLIGLVYLPALAIAAYELSRLFSRLSYQPYGLKSQR